MATFSEYLTTIRSSSAQRILKIEVLDSNENVIDEITANVINGDVQSNDELGARRNANITFENSEGNYIPSSSGNIWMNNKFRIWTGVKVGTEDYYVSRGIFLISEPDIESKMAENISSIQFLDKFALLNGTLGGTIENTYIIPSGTSVVSAVQAIFTEAGEIRLPIIEPTSENTPYTIIKEAGATYGDLLIELANMLSWTVYYDKNGFPRFEPRTNIETAGSVWDLTTSEIHYLGSNHRYEFTNVYNNVVVIGDNVNGTTYRASASDTDPTSETRIALIGKKTLLINDSLIFSTALAQERADAELQASISIVETTNVSSMPIDIIEGGNVITITDASSDLNNTRFLVKNVSFPLTTSGDMSMDCWKGRVL